MPKISVIIPVYNVEKYLCECLDSVINQTLQDIEIICVNDGSKDGSLDILKEYAKNDNRIVIIDKKNEGVGKTRNVGIDKASGEFVCFIDPDDIYPTQDILESLYVNAKENQVLICGGEFACFTNTNPQLTQNYINTLSGYLFDSNQIICYKDYQFDYGYHRFIYNREFLIRNNIYYPNYKRFQDPPFFVKAMIIARYFYAIDKITYGYRRGHNKVTWTKQKLNDLLSGISDDMRMAKQNSLDKLNYYSLSRLNEHYNGIADILTLKEIIKIYQMEKYNSNVKTFIRDKNLYLSKRIFKQIFSIRNEDIHKVICLLGFKFKIKSKKLIEREKLKGDN